jgi:hypothetical protein
MPMAATEKELTEKELVHAGCEAGLQDGVQKMTGVLLGCWGLAKTPGAQTQCVQQFRTGLQKYKEAYAQAQQVIDAVFS